MNRQRLTTHLARLGISLKQDVTSQPDGVKLGWTTAPENGYPYPTSHFRTLKEVRATWQSVGARRLWELNTAVELWNDPRLSAEDRHQLLRWSREDFAPAPASVLARLGETVGPLPRDWAVKLEVAAKRHGCVAYSWLRAAVLEAAPQ